MKLFRFKNSQMLYILICFFTRARFFFAGNIYRITKVFVVVMIMPLSISAQLFMNPYVENTSSYAKNVEIVSVDKQKKRVIVSFKVNNTSSNDLNFRLYPTEDRRSHKIVDVTTKKEYRQKCSFAGAALCTQSKDVTVPGNSSYSFKLIFQELDDNVTDIDIIESGGSGSWCFYGVKLLNEQALAVWKQQKAQEESENQAAIIAKKEADKAKKEQEKLAYEKRLEDERRQAAEQAAQREKNVAKTAEELTKQQTYTAPEFDGVYAVAGSKYVQLTKANVLLGSFGRMVGSYSDFNLFRNYFLPYDPPNVYVSKSKPRFILIGDAVREISSYRVSDVIDVKKERALVARDVNADKMYYDSPIYIPHVLDNLGYKINQIQRKTNSSTKAEIQVTETLDPAQSYVLWNIKTGAYFFFKVK